MKTFYLKNKGNEDCKLRVDANTLDQAIKLFSKIKKLGKDDLLKNYIVTDRQL